MDDLYLDNIDEFVNDQNKIVTYKWLSLTLGVHVNLAKQMLYHYLDHKRKESSALLHATYFVSGKFVENGTTYPCPQQRCSRLMRLHRPHRQRRSTPNLASRVILVWPLNPTPSSPKLLQILFHGCKNRGTHHQALRVK